MSTAYTRVKLSVFVPLYVRANECGSVAPATSVGSIERAGDCNRSDLPLDSLVATSYAAPLEWQEIAVGKREMYLLNGYYCPRCAEEIMTKLQTALSG